MISKIHPLHDPFLMRTACYVNGDWVAAGSSKKFNVENPSTLASVAQCPDFDVEDTEAAIEAAHQAFASYRKTPARTRARWLRRWSELMIENAEDLARIITLENGKPLADATAEVHYAASFFEWFSEEAPRIYGETIQASNPSCRIVTLKEPIGVCGLIAPWNFPGAMITRKVGPALAAGCTVVVKAPAEAPLTALALAELAHRAGIPKGVVNIITASAHNTIAVGKILTTHPIIKKVSFTGSTGVGKILMSQSSTTLKKLSLELGGNAPFIVFEDADLDVAARGLIASKFRISGQTCVCANRILVQRQVYDAFTRKVLDIVRTFKVGDGLSETTTHGPLIHQRAAQKVDEHVKDAVSKGARVLHGGEPLKHLGPNFFDITLLVDMAPGMKICTEETFGPIAAFFAFDTEADAIEMANDTEVGLAGYFFSQDASRCWRVAEALEVGMVGVNVGSISDPAAPFGGVKQSGFGREGSKYGIDEYLVTKMVMTGVSES
ncbi:succinate-semialdehyde dehydrogenase [Verticillium alfalfae VaMs.102]|uniref:Succinate-semialdehyde dehydrogenase n=1 Tax=Verticillium alfalfae (strain VaMs.102 / ATCC MYA-4576 / FGSC 10136) TaxID=526221 RepID=C9SX34_VERA1|nr:succinate-semialdehyde dehydrogenase [Verticillium alfalfae VaMs.102]EEY23224.1 succinate-semialdehyde dehydrogenase [Verticillium alfalfae VaMs.102]